MFYVHSGTIQLHMYEFKHKVKPCSVTTLPHSGGKPPKLEVKSKCFRYKNVFRDLVFFDMWLVQCCNFSKSDSIITEKTRESYFRYCHMIAQSSVF